MMKNKKLAVVFILILAFLLLMVSYTKGSDDIEELPTIVTNQEDNTVDNNTTNNEEVNNLLNVESGTNNTDNTNTNTANSNTLPQTGVQGDTTLFIFIAICVASAIYAYFKIRKYNNLH